MTRSTTRFDDDDHILFQDTFASGHSHQSLWTRLMSANNCLSVVLTPSTLTISTRFWGLKWLLKRLDLMQVIAVDEILSVRRRWFWWFHIVFQSAEGEHKTITLATRFPHQLEQAFQETGVPCRQESIF